MTQEDKQLLLKDLCARIPYGVIGTIEHYDEITKEPSYPLGVLWGIDGHNRVQFAYLPEYADDKGAYNYFDFKLFKPFLRPLSSMTEEEMKECEELGIGYNIEDSFGERFELIPSYRLFDWLNKNKFDYRGLIPKGRAIEVTESNNPYKDCDYEH